VLRSFFLFAVFPSVSPYFTAVAAYRAAIGTMEPMFPAAHFPEYGRKAQEIGAAIVGPPGTVLMMPREG
jgi:hypothetical protein